MTGLTDMYYNVYIIPLYTLYYFAIREEGYTLYYMHARFPDLNNITINLITFLITTSSLYHALYYTLYYTFKTWHKIQIINISCMRIGNYRHDFLPFLR